MYICLSIYIYFLFFSFFLRRAEKNTRIRGGRECIISSIQVVERVVDPRTRRESKLRSVGQRALRGGRPCCHSRRVRERDPRRTPRRGMGAEGEKE